MRVARVTAQAKINLFLNVGAREESGYHHLVTLFQRIDLADEIIVRVGGNDRSLDVSGPHIPASGLGPTEKNLAYRAAIEYAANTRTRFPKGFAIELTKHIPVGGGLGGGSADAGAVLRALDALAPRPMDPQKLQQIAASLGADVPFFATEHVSALGTNRGEVLTPQSVLNSVADVLLVVPPFSIATADAYRWLDEDRVKWVPPNIEPRSGNDFEPVVEKRYPQLREIRERLVAMGARLARLAGSGSCVFGVFDQSTGDPRAVALDALVIPTRTSSRVVQVEVQE
jgi:4-diphosphocytidyl-2-C-methyl-D-erythritol kinase